MPKHNLASQVKQLKAQQDAFQAMLVADMADLFDIPVSGVEDYKLDKETQVETGILASGGTRFRFRIDGAAGVKELAIEQS